MILAQLDIDDLQATVLVVVIEADNLARMRKADPVTLESIAQGGLLKPIKYPSKFSLLIAYEEDEVELYKLAQKGGIGLIEWLRRGYRFDKSKGDGTENAFSLTRRT
jgi:hypothetical protein